MEAVQTDGTSITKMQTILHTVHMLSTESLASKFDNKNQKFGDTVDGRHLWRRVQKIVQFCYATPTDDGKVKFSP